jgi:tetratricopeptide (TPR) repeat protein
MSIGSSQDGGPPSSEAVEAPKHGARSFGPIFFLGDVFRTSLRLSRKLSFALWSTLPSYLPFYLIVIVAGYAAWEAQTPVTIIAPFQLPKGDLPFSGDIVADALQDGLTSIHNDIEKEKLDPRLRSTEMDLPDLRGLIIPKFGRVQVPTRFAVEVKGLSYEGIISAARAVMGTETTVSGDVILNGKEFILIARTADGGPWESLSSPISAEGLKRASRDLAEKILATQDPTLAGAALLKDGQADQALAVLNRAQNLNPTDPRVKLNLCMGFEANRRYAEAKGCYQDVLKMNPSSPQEVSERLAQAYYLNGERDLAVMRFEELAHKQGYTGALLALGKALDDMGQHEDALKAYDEFLAAEHRSRNLAIAHVNRGFALACQGKHEEALKEYQNALDNAPGDVLILANIGVELAKAGDPDAGIAQLQSVVDENLNQDSVPFAFLQLGILFQEKRDWQRAGDQFRRATDLRPNYTEAHARLAYVLAQEGRRSEALTEYAKVARLSPREVDRRYSQVLANQWLGNTLRDQGQYAAAVSAYREAIRLKRNYRAAHCELGFVLEKQRHLSQAIQEYRSALLAKSKELDSSASLILAHRRLGSALVSGGRAHQAESVAEIRKATELVLCLGTALYDKGTFVQAASQYTGAIEMDPQSATARNDRALALDKEGLVQQAALKSRTAVTASAAEPGAGLAQGQHPRCEDLQ